MLKTIRRYPLAYLLAALLLFLYFSSNIAAFYTDWLWFGEVGYRKTFLRIYGTRIVLFGAFGLASFLLAYINLVLARRISPPVEVRGAGKTAPVYDTTVARPLGRAVRFFGGLRTLLDVLLLIGALFFAVIAGITAQSEWDSFQRFLHPVVWGKVDPQFGRDLGLYIFTLPFLRFMQGWLLVVLLLVGGGVLLVYLYQQGINAASGRARITPPVRAHLSVLACLALLVQAWGYYLDRFDLLLGSSAVAPGAGYAAIHSRLPMLNLLVGATLLTALAAAINIWRRNLALAGVGTGLWLAFGLVGIVVPGMVQRVVVRPNEGEKETPYIARAIAATRDAYGVADTHMEAFPAADTPLSAADLARNRATLASIRLWDYEPLRETYPQQQGLRQYYVFPDVDVDRYRLSDGTTPQVLIAAREIAPDRLDERAQSWQNTHLRYTHGFGAVVSPAGRATPEGLPEYLLRDIPPVASDPALALSEPRLYYGEAAESNSYVVVDAAPDEFDYPADEAAAGSANAAATPEDRLCRYTGTGGVALTEQARLAFSIRFNGWANLMLSRDLTPRSRLMMFRRVPDRVKRIAPFLQLDHDPYPVIAGGRIFWIQDCYTTAASYPYSEPVDWGDDLSPTRTVNYLRNSVKAVVDAYNGSVTLFAADPTDPILKCYERTFPGLIRPLREMDSTLRAHRRYPEDLFTLQRQILADYHVTDPQVFYARADSWQMPRRQETVEQESGSDEGSDPNSGAMAPYYVTLRLPGETREEFALLSPFTPRDRQNMIALLAARCDDSHYGGLILYRFPASRNVAGPEQIGKRLRSGSKISPYLSLNDQKGSKVLFGSMLILPVERTLLYVQPVYVKASSAGDGTGGGGGDSSIPEMKQVIAAWDDRIAMEPTLAAALADLFGGGGAPPPTPGGGTTAAPAGGGAGSDIRSLAQQAATQFEQAQALLKSGDWAGYGRAQQALGETLKRLRGAAGR